MPVRPTTGVFADVATVAANPSLYEVWVPTGDGWQWVNAAEVLDSESLTDTAVTVDGDGVSVWRRGCVARGTRGKTPAPTTPERPQTPPDDTNNGGNTPPSTRRRRVPLQPTDRGPLPDDRDLDNLMRKNGGRTRVVENLMVRWGHRCFYCGRRLRHPDDYPDHIRAAINDGTYGWLPTDYPTIDHYVPRSKGGRSLLPNLRLACPKCNQLKGDNDANVAHDTPYPLDADTTDCPECNGRGIHHDDVLCGWCDGRGVLTHEKAVSKLAETLARLQASQKKVQRLRRDRDEMRDLIAALFGSTHAHVDRALLVKKLNAANRTIAAMRERIVELTAAARTDTNT